VLADIVAGHAGDDTIPSHAREALGVRDADTAVDELRRLARRADMPLGEIGRERHPHLAPRLLAEVRDAPDPDLALAHLADLFGRLRGVERYAERLASSPELARGLVGLFGASETLSRQLLARPELIDAVISGAAGAPAIEEIDALVETSISLARRECGPEDDPLEAALAAMRRVQRETIVQIGLADIAGVLTAGDVARRLSALAGALLEASFRLAAEETAERFGTRPDATSPLDGIAVIALGSLAARELGYGGDVDLIVLYDREGETRGGRRTGVTMAEYAARLTQRAMSLLSMPHPAGPGYAVDTRLRPSGAQGTLVVSFDAFTRYHSNASDRPGAASWERQALIRARFACGDPRTGTAAETMIQRAAYEQGVDAKEIARLRERMERELGREAVDAIALKYGRGGLVDVEFAAQALQMAHGHDASIRTPTTRVALARLRDAGRLDPGLADSLLVGEKLLRRALLATRLVTARSTLRVGTPAANTVARKLGYRDRAERSAEQAFVSDLGMARERVRRAFESVLASIGSPQGTP
jgi:glutamate-ammonia-ligase adenylyltransferase